MTISPRLRQWKSRLSFAPITNARHAPNCAQCWASSACRLARKSTEPHTTWPGVKDMAAYNGHRSWNAWNVSLWLNNDEGLYRRAVELASAHGISKGARLMFRELEGERTPDGGVYNLTTVREAMRDII